MYCPLCKHTTMNRNQLEENLTAYECGHCSGRWVSSYQYWQWKDKSGKSLTEPSSESAADLPVEDNRKARLCPECGHFLRHFAVGGDICFSLDHCGNCGGMWFDKNEWESLKARGLHDDVHMIFSEVWQNRIRRQQQEQAIEKIFEAKLGAADFSRIQGIKKWIQNHPLRSELMAFLKG